jgi:hypothetical protein
MINHIIAELFGICLENKKKKYKIEANRRLKQSNDPSQRRTRRSQTNVRFLSKY